MLVLNPNKRITAEEALRHRFFSVYPQPADQIEIELMLKNTN